VRNLPISPVFSRRDARTLGWSDSALTRAVVAGRISQVRRGQFSATEVDGRIAAIAAARDRADSVVSHRSALLMHGLPILGSRPSVAEITVPPTGSGSARAAHLHRAGIRPEDVVVVDGVPVTSVARTVVDVARARPTAAAVTAIDAALHDRRATLEELQDVLLFQWNWPGIRRAHRAVRLSDERAESPLESVSRLVIRWLRLPRPDLQTRVRDGRGYPAGRLDFYWDEWGVAGEADGRSKYSDRPVLTEEKLRQEHLEDDSMVFVRWGWSDAIYHPHLLRSRLESGFDRGSARDRSGFPRLWSVVPR
jgi:hypothetical protein